jgi:putative DNA primase/helicase
MRADFLRDVLEAGPLPTKEIEAEAKDAGISWRTIKRAKKDLGVEAYREPSAEGAMRGGQWWWRLPKGAKNYCEDQLLTWPP